LDHKAKTVLETFQKNPGIPGSRKWQKTHSTHMKHNLSHNLDISAVWQFKTIHQV